MIWKKLLSREINLKIQLNFASLKITICIIKIFFIKIEIILSKNWKILIIKFLMFLMHTSKMVMIIDLK